MVWGVSFTWLVQILVLTLVLSLIARTNIANAYACTTQNVTQYMWFCGALICNSQMPYRAIETDST